MTIKFFHKTKFGLKVFRLCSRARREPFITVPFYRLLTSLRRNGHGPFPTQCTRVSASNAKHLTECKMGDFIQTYDHQSLSQNPFGEREASRLCVRANAVYVYTQVSADVRDATLIFFQTFTAEVYLDALSLIPSKSPFDIISLLTMCEPIPKPDTPALR
jgi:hypothetical protein